MNHDRLKEAPVFEKVLPNSQYSKNGGKCAIRNYRITAHGKDGQDGKKKHGNTKIQNSTITFLDIKNCISEPIWPILQQKFAVFEVFFGISVNNFFMGGFFKLA